MSINKERLKSPVLRFWSKVRIGGEGCWLWEGAGKSRGRYGFFQHRGRSRGAHAAAYELYHNTSILPGYVVCHSCDTTLCVRPDHLFLGTSSDNKKDMDQKKRGHNSRKTHCIRGHAFDEANTHTTKAGIRQCRKCHSLREGRYYHEGRRK